MAEQSLPPSAVEAGSEKMEEGRTEADPSGPRDQHSSPDGATPPGHGRVEKEKVEEDECVTTDQEDWELRGKGEDGIKDPVITQWNAETLTLYLKGEIIRVGLVMFSSPVGEQRKDIVSFRSCLNVWKEEKHAGGLRIPEPTFDPTGRKSYKEACQKLGVAPSSAFLRQIQSSEMLLMHRRLGPQGTKALAVPLVTNTSVLKLNLRDNWMEGMGGAAIAEMLKENCYITEVDLSDNNLGDRGARAVADTLQKSSTLVRISLSGNNFTDEAAERLAQALAVNTKLQHLDLSHNALSEHAGQILGATLSENTGLRSISLAWNCIRGRGAVALANGLGGNIFLKSVDLSFNGFGKEGAVALARALRENEVLEELNVSNNRIPPEGAIHLAMGLKHNKTIRILQIGRNPIQSAGCYGILQSMQENPDSAIEALDFSDITVSQDFSDLYAAVKEVFPELTVNHGGEIGPFTRQKPGK